MDNINRRYTPDGKPESKFRGAIRDILYLDLFTRDEQIYEELRRLKRIEAQRHSQLNALTEER